MTSSFPPDVSFMQVGELHSLAAGGGGAVLLDVREPWELQAARIRLHGTQYLDIPMQQIPGRMADIARLGDAELDSAGPPPVVCICHHGVRSAQVVAFLRRQGVQNVYNLDGGIDAWSVEVDPSVPRY